MIGVLKLVVSKVEVTSSEMTSSEVTNSEMTNSESSKPEAELESEVRNIDLTGEMLSEEERLSALIEDNRREIDELTEEELKNELEKEVGHEIGSWQRQNYLTKNFKHIGEEIPKDVPAIYYFRYILQNFRITKPKEEWTDRDYKVYKSRKVRLMVASIIRSHLKEQNTPFDARQRRIVERVRNGTDFDYRNPPEEFGSYEKPFR